MKGFEYPTIQRLITELQNALSSECDPTQFELEIKYSKLISTRTQQFQTLLSNSKSQIILMNNLPNYKQYRINAMGTKQQFDTVNSNASKLKQVQKSSCIMKLDMKFGREKIERIRGIDEWVFSHKGQQFKKQYNILINGKQFRVDLSRKEVINENSQVIFKKLGNGLTEQIKILRFKQSNTYHISPYYQIVTSWIHQSQDAKLKQKISQIIKNQNGKQMDQFIFNQIPRNNKIPGKYQIELVVTNQGIDKIMKIIKKNQEVNLFIGNMMMNFEALSKIYFKGLKEQPK